MENSENNFQEELKNCYILIGNSKRVNTRLLSKEAAKYFSLQLNYDIKPFNHKNVIEEIFSLENVFLVTTPCTDVFVENNEYIGEYETYSKKSIDENGCLNDIKEMLSLGHTVYFYKYYQNVDDNNFYWRYKLIK